MMPEQPEGESRQRGRIPSDGRIHPEAFVKSNHDTLNSCSDILPYIYIYVRVKYKVYSLAFEIQSRIQFRPLG
jgi:hypothetical protein